MKSLLMFFKRISVRSFLLFLIWVQILGTYIESTTLPILIVLGMTLNVFISLIDDFQKIKIVPGKFYSTNQTIKIMREAELAKPGQRYLLEVQDSTVNIKEVPKSIDTMRVKDFTEF